MNNNEVCIEAFGFRLIVVKGRDGIQLTVGSTEIDVDVRERHTDAVGEDLTYHFSLEYGDDEDGDL